MSPEDGLKKDIKEIIILRVCEVKLFSIVNRVFGHAPVCEETYENIATMNNKKVRKDCKKIKVFIVERLSRDSRPCFS